MCVNAKYKMFLTRYLLGTTMILALFQLKSINADPRIQACGKNLREMLALVCQSKYYGPGHKRFLGVYSDDYLDKSGEDYMKPPNFLNDIFMDHQPIDVYNSEAPQYRFAKNTPGIVDECCYNTCTLSTLQRYCA
ncbi:hypothetical protein Trydic_g14593 [Trypoxylus dichotomus]